MSTLDALANAGLLVEGERWYAPHWIDGRAQASADGRRFEVKDPARGRVIADAARGAAADVDRALQAAAKASKGPWASMGTLARAGLLEAIADRIERERAQFALLESLDGGKPITAANEREIQRVIDHFRFFAGAVRHSHLEAFQGPSALHVEHRRPVGVVVLITPWNLPLQLLTWKLAPALATGNCVVAKASELTPLTASRLAALLTDLGLPEGVFNLVHGFGVEVGEPLVADDRVGAISFTGGTATGARIAAVAAPKFKKLCLELGGKNPTVVFADADLERAADEAARAAFSNQGQICLCGSRVIVERSVAEQFTEALVQRADRWAPGDPQDPKTTMGSLISPEHRAKVERYLQLAREQGGTVLTGGVRPTMVGALQGGAFLTPAVITGLSADSTCAQEEIFGPVLTVHPFDDEEEAIRLANGVRYGLSASLWTRDQSRAHRVAGAIHAGIVWVNCWLVRDLRVAFGGQKDSGVGREGGQHALDFYTESSSHCFSY